MNNEIKHPYDGSHGTYGPNDGGYIHNCIVEAAKLLKRAQELYSQGHYPHSNAKIIPDDHSLRLAMKELSELDKEYARYANKIPDENLFTTYKPLHKDIIRWNVTPGNPGFNFDTNE